MRNVIGTIGIALCLSVIPGIGAVKSQTDWLDDPVIVESPKWEKIPESTPSYTVEIAGDPVRTRTQDMVMHWWEVGGEHTNDPTIPDEIEESAIIYGDMFGISPEFMEAICHQETGGTYRCDLIDKSGKCYGPMQIHIGAQRDRIKAYGLKAEDMLTADGAMLVAGSYIAELFEKYEDPAAVLMAYNGATTALRRYRETGELNRYTKRVLQKAEELEKAHEVE